MNVSAAFWMVAVLVTGCAKSETDKKGEEPRSVASEATRTGKATDSASAAGPVGLGSVPGVASRPAPEIKCPDIAIRPHARIQLEKPLSSMTATVEYEAGADKETCSIEVGVASGITRIPGPGGGMVGSPSTKVGSTCKFVATNGLNEKGEVSYLSVLGTPAKFTLKLKNGAKLLGEGTFTPDYTPDQCRFVKPIVQLAMP